MDYQEIQRFSSLTWVWFVILPIAGLMWYSFYQELMVKQPGGTHPAPNLMAILFWIGFGIVMPLVFFLGGLRTEVRADGLHLQVFPIPVCTKHFDYADIETYAARQYHPLREFGGWGIRFGFSGKAYTISGNQGLQLEFKNGKRLLIGSQHPDRLVDAIDRYLLT